MANSKESVMVKNVSKGPTSLAAPGRPKIFIDAGKSHTFDDVKAYEFYKLGIQSLKSLGTVEVTMGGKVDKVIPTPAMDAQKHKMEEAKAKSEPAPAPVAEEAAVEEEEEEEDKQEKAKPAAKPAAKSSKK